GRHLRRRTAARNPRPPRSRTMSAPAAAAAAPAPAFPPMTKARAGAWLGGIAVILVGVSLYYGNVGIVFALLVALMLSGIPVSIALGLTVLTFLFLLTQVPVESVALKLFTGIEKFEIMAIPFFILAGNFLTHGGVAKRMIGFASSLVGHWHG